MYTVLTTKNYFTLLYLNMRTIKETTLLYKMLHHYPPYGLVISFNYIYHLTTHVSITDSPLSLGHISLAFNMVRFGLDMSNVSRNM